MWERWGKLLTRHEGKVSPLFLQLVVAISEIKILEISFPKMFGYFNFQLRFPHRSNSFLYSDKNISLDRLYTLQGA